MKLITALFLALCCSFLFDITHFYSYSSSNGVEAARIKDNSGQQSVIKANRLKKGDTVALISPASPYSYEVSNVTSYLQYLNHTLNNFGLNVYYSSHMSDIWGYLAGHDADRAGDIDYAVKRKDISILLSNRGGYGCDRIIDMLDYNSIKQNPKIFIGYSDLTALIHAIYFQTGLITFYGPMGIDNWDNLNGYYFQQILFGAQLMTFKNPTKYPITTIKGGTAKGKLFGGNLSVFAATVGSYIPIDYEWEKTILFLEEVGEQPYTIDRMLTTLHLTGILPKVAGFVWGICRSCNASNPSRSLTLNQVIVDRIAPLNIPSYMGAMIGHIDQQFTLPIGTEVMIDADLGTITMLESALL